MKFIFILLTIGGFSQVSSSLAQTKDYVPLSTKESILFKIKNFGLTVEGSFEKLTGKIFLDEGHFENSFLDVTVEVSTLDTKNSLRDKHLRQEEYFDVPHFPRIRFQSSKISSTNEADTWQMEGKLTIKKTTKVISFPFKVSTANNRYLLTGQFNLNRQDFNVGTNSFSLSDKVMVF